jgi:hypothetical protein
MRDHANIGHTGNGSAARRKEATARRVTRSQNERVLDQMHLDRDDGHGTCGNTLLVEMRVARYAARVWELRHLRGAVINERPCTRHEHEGAVAEYLLIQSPRDIPKQLALAS